MWLTQVQSDTWMHEACAQSQGIGKEQVAVVLPWKWELDGPLPLHTPAE